MDSVRYAVSIALVIAGYAAILYAVGDMLNDLADAITEYISGDDGD